LKNSEGGSGSYSGPAVKYEITDGPRILQPRNIMAKNRTIKHLIMRFT